MASKRKRAVRDHRAVALKGARTRAMMAAARRDVSRFPIKAGNPREKLWRAVWNELRSIGGAA